MYEEALHYAVRLGWPIVPDHRPMKDGACSCRDADCDSIGKHPRIFDWPRKASRDPKQLDSWFRRFYKNSNMSFVVPDDIAVLDVDYRYGADELLEELVGEYGDFYTDGHTVRTGGGIHVYFRAAHPVSSAVNLFGQWIGERRGMSGLELKGPGGKIMLPPSLHRSGVVYEWMDARPESVESFPYLPDWLRGAGASSGAGNVGTNWKGVLRDGDMVLESMRDLTMTAIIGGLRRYNDHDTTVREMLEIMCELNVRQFVPPLRHRQVVKCWRSGMGFAPARDIDCSADCAWGCP